MRDFFGSVIPIYSIQWLVMASLILWLPATLLAHGTLLRAEPPIDTRVAKRPSEIRLWFNESVESRFSRITVHRATRDAATGEMQPQDRVDDGLVAGSRVTRELAVKLPDNLPPGLYLIQWKVLSIDSHRTTGKFTLTYAP